jgi:hypothetical protein
VLFADRSAAGRRVSACFLLQFFLGEVEAVLLRKYDNVLVSSGLRRDVLQFILQWRALIKALQKIEYGFLAHDIAL